MDFGNITTDALIGTNTIYRDGSWMRDLPDVVTSSLKLRSTNVVQIGRQLRLIADSMSHDSKMRKKDEDHNSRESHSTRHWTVTLLRLTLLVQFSLPWRFFERNILYMS
ncbi:uncharacterized protein LOC111087202 isoform X3 [Limulus polyphemus]|uniref:Uncharacterized protein LOC111087202 isoform X3 n=1 Tax=Limulus polyphemus TaxID=6850 RepID=A0ABM1SYQ8_LIMPO|nr:uncharacterized protein LOC111087202 isoform X3 [Limulus polyphemus]